MPTVLRVAVPVPLPRLFDYLLPVGADAAKLIPGCRVLVPFGRTRRVGVLLDIAHESSVPSHRLKPALMLLDARPLLDAELLHSLTWASRYYQYPLGAVLECALPVGLRQAKPLPAAGERALALTETGAVTSPAGKPTARTNLLLQILAQGPRTYLELDNALAGWRASAASLRKRGMVVGMTLTTRARPHMPLIGPPLNIEQQRAVDGIGAAHGGFAPFLLEGVTGSGKTEVYLALIEQALARGQQALIPRASVVSGTCPALGTQRW
jgi:primosomal protein N' (replication factor Y)